MKHSLMFVAVLFISIMALAQNPAAKPVKAESDGMPYKAKFTTKFSIGSNQYARTILSLWKDWDNNTLDNMNGLFADDVNAVFADGTTFKGKDHFIKSAKEYRSMFSSVVSDITTYTTLKMDETGESAVLVWGEETATKKDGTVQKSLLHEVWIFDKSGLIKGMHQWAAQLPKEDKK